MILVAERRPVPPGAERDSAAEPAPPLLFFLLTCHRKAAVLWRNHRKHMPPEKLDLLQGTLDLLVLQTLASMGPMHGYGIARRIEQVGADALLLNQGTIYAALVRLQQGKWIGAEWGTSDNNRKAKYYQITDRGRKRLGAETENWQRMAGVVQRILDAPAGEAAPR
jgi:transcriptional regulator